MPLTHYPKTFKDLLFQTGKNFVKTIGEEAVKEAILSVLFGENLRDSTEFITRRKLILSNGALFVMFLKGCSEFPDYLDKLSNNVANHKKIKTHSANGFRTTKGKIDIGKIGD